MPDVSSDGFNLFQAFVLKTYGISLPDDRRAYVSAQLQKILNSMQLADEQALITRLAQPEQSELAAAVIDAITIHETSWYRDVDPFDILQNIILPEIHRKRPLDTLRIWSAACSTGQEAYSISMVIETVQRAHPTYFVMGAHVLATDVSTSVLTHAVRGEYDALSMSRGLLPQWQQVFFDETQDHHWRVKEAIRKRIQFRQFNLLEDYTSLGSFDVIFCRNVLVYFSPDEKKRVLEKMHSALKPGGYLILGATETLGAYTQFQSIQCNPGVIYRTKY